MGHYNVFLSLDVSAFKDVFRPLELPPCSTRVLVYRWKGPLLPPNSEISCYWAFGRYDTQRFGRLYIENDGTPYAAPLPGRRRWWLPTKDSVYIKVRFDKATTAHLQEDAGDTRTVIYGLLESGWRKRG